MDKRDLFKTARVAQTSNFVHLRGQVVELVRRDGDLWKVRVANDWRTLVLTDRDLCNFVL